MFVVTLVIKIVDRDRKSKNLVESVAQSGIIPCVLRFDFEKVFFLALVDRHKNCGNIDEL